GHENNIKHEWKIGPQPNIDLCSVILPRMREKPLVSIIGAGNLGTALSVSLRGAGYPIEYVVARPRGESLKRAQTLGREVGARVAVGVPAGMQATVVWLCVPDSEISHVARSFAEEFRWKGRVA